MSTRDFPYSSLRTAIGRDLFLLCYRYPSFTRKLLVALTNRGFQAVFFYRIANWCWRHRIPVIPLIITRITQTFYAIDIAFEAKLGPGVVIVHGFGVVIGNSTRIEGDCRIFHEVTFGNRGSEWVGSPKPDGQPYIEKNCMFAAGAKLLGPITVGFNSVVGANAVVLHNLPENSIAAGNPAKVVGTRPLMDEQLRRVNPAPEATHQVASSIRQCLSS